MQNFVECLRYVQKNSTNIFNIDLERNSNFTEILNLFVECESLIVADYLFTQKTDFTYKQNRIIKNDKDKNEILRCVTSRIDHVLVNENFAEKIEQVNILNEQDHQSNTSDHLAIKIDLKKLNINIEPKQKLKNNTTLTSKINWNDENTQETYAQKLRHKLLNKNIISKLNETNNENSKGNITEIINELGRTMRETIEEITSFNYNSKSINNKHLKKNKWWDEEMKNQKQKVNNAYLKWKSTDFTSEELEKQLKIEKNKFRTKQREKVKLIEDINVKRIDTLFHVHRDKFWKEMKRIRKTDESINVPMDDLRNNFERLFNEKNNLKNENNLSTAQDEINEYEKIINETLDISNIKVDQDTIKEIIKELPNGKSIGFADVSNEMVKYGCIEELSE
ncbi:unnamed protein product, partial [Brachionus calyciflorus]